MNATPSNETAFLLLTLVGVMGAWDGLIRRHIRITNDAFQLYVSIRGQAAATVGTVCLFLAIGGIAGLVNVIGGVVSGCRGTLTCVVQNMVLAPVSSWEMGFLSVVTLFVFVLWVIGASDLQGPYRKIPIGRGIWVHEKDLIRLAIQRLSADGLPILADDVILRTARLVRQNTAMLGLFARHQIHTADSIDQQKLADMVAAMRANDGDAISPEARRVLIEAILDYYHDVYRRARAPTA